MKDRIRCLAKASLSRTFSKTVSYLRSAVCLPFFVWFTGKVTVEPLTFIEANGAKQPSLILANGRKVQIARCYKAVSTLENAKNEIFTISKNNNLDKGKISFQHQLRASETNMAPEMETTNVNQNLDYSAGKYTKASQQRARKFEKVQAKKLVKVH